MGWRLPPPYSHSHSPDLQDSLQGQGQLVQAHFCASGRMPQPRCQPALPQTPSYILQLLFLRQRQRIREKLTVPSLRWDTWPTFSSTRPRHPVPGTPSVVGTAVGNRRLAWRQWQAASPQQSAPSTQETADGYLRPHTSIAQTAAACARPTAHTRRGSPIPNQQHPLPSPALVHSLCPLPSQYLQSSTVPSPAACVLVPIPAGALTKVMAKS